VRCLGQGPHLHLGDRDGLSRGQGPHDDRDVAAHFDEGVVVVDHLDLRPQERVSRLDRGQRVRQLALGEGAVDVGEEHADHAVEPPDQPEVLLGGIERAQHAR
jgi:hypothetical protein